MFYPFQVLGALESLELRHVGVWFIGFPLAFSILHPEKDNELANMEHALDDALMP